MSKKAYINAFRQVNRDLRKAETNYANFLVTDEGSDFSDDEQRVENADNATDDRSLHGDDTVPSDIEDESLGIRGCHEPVHDISVAEDIDDVVDLFRDGVNIDLPYNNLPEDQQEYHGDSSSDSEEEELATRKSICCTRSFLSFINSVVQTTDFELRGFILKCLEVRVYYIVCL